MRRDLAGPLLEIVFVCLAGRDEQFLDAVERQVLVVLQLGPRPLVEAGDEGQLAEQEQQRPRVRADRASFPRPGRPQPWWASARHMPREPRASRGPSKRTRSTRSGFRARGGGPPCGRCGPALAAPAGRGIAGKTAAANCSMATFFRAYGSGRTAELGTNRLVSRSMKARGICSRQGRPQGRNHRLARIDRHIAVRRLCHRRRHRPRWLVPVRRPIFRDESLRFGLRHHSRRRQQLDPPLHLRLKRRRQRHRHAVELLFQHHPPHRQRKLAAAVNYRQASDAGAETKYG